MRVISLSFNDKFDVGKQFLVDYLTQIIAHRAWLLDTCQKQFFSDARHVLVSVDLAQFDEFMNKVFGHLCRVDQIRVQIIQLWKN